MRGLRSFGVLFVVLLAVGGYAYFVESKKPAPDGADKKEKVFSVESDKIDEITIRSESGETTALKKSGTDWQIVAPTALKADTPEITGIASNLSSLEVQRVIDENPADLTEYSLAKPRVEVTFKSGGQEHRIQLGRKTPPGTDIYAKLPEQKRVFLIPSYLDTQFNKTTFDLRDKTALAFKREEADTLTVTAGGKTMKFAKKGSEWRIVEPVDARADFSGVEGLVTRLGELQMKTIAAPDASKAADFGLDAPAATVSIGTGSSLATLIVGKSSGEDVYARDQSRPAVFTVESSLLNDLKKDAGEYRQKDLFDARAFNATRVELARNGQTVALEKVKSKNKEGQEEESWKQVAPSAKDVDRTKADGLISAVTQARAASFVDPAPKGAIDKPELKVTVKSDDGKREETVTFSRSGTDVYATRAGEPGVAKVDTATLDGIIKALEELK
jgi:hypothetical protein